MRGHWLGAAAALASIAYALPVTGAALDALEPARDAIRRHDYAHAVDLMRPLAQAGDAEAEYQLAQLLRSAEGIAHDPSAACTLLVDAAQRGHVRAAYSLGTLAENGACPDTGKSSAQWLEVAATGGHAGAADKLRGEAPTAPDAGLRRAARKGDLPTIRSLLTHTPPDTADSAGRTALLSAS